MRTALESMYSRLDISPTGKGKWVLNKPFTYYKGSKGSSDIINIPKGFEFDGASVPRILWSFVGHPMEQDTLIGACIHDFLYSKKKLSRQECDNKFNEVMIICDTGEIKRISYYLGVRLFGYSRY